MDDATRRVFVTGATGYVGGRLVPKLLERGFHVRCAVREPRKLDQRPWRAHDRIEIVQDNLEDVDKLAANMRGCSAAYYLIHSMVVSGPDYPQKDSDLARNFAKAAAKSSLERIIYLGGLGKSEADLSRHLKSRRETEEQLKSTGVLVTTLRAAIILGSGSASFEILRYLVERLPIMITPKWVQTECQPVAIADVLHWLVESLENPETAGLTLEIGGPDILSYRKLMEIAAEEMDLWKRIIIGIPFFTPRLSSAWISLVTPVTFRLARPLADGLRNEVIVTNSKAQELMPHDALTARIAIRRAIAITQRGQVPTRWSVAGPIPGDPEWSGGKMFVDQRSIEINATPDKIFAAVCKVGGGHGWYAGDILWQIRGWMDQVVGGPGLRRGRRDPENVEFGETLDFWRVVKLNRDKELMLHAEMKLPGIARLGFKIQPSEGNKIKSTLIMTARFWPRGLAGLAYWYAVVPLHYFVFGGMLNGIKKAAENDRNREDLNREN
ncbi:MAG: SDR family oxidoreductase [Planctomycetota bacterium]